MSRWRGYCEDHHQEFRWQDGCPCCFYGRVKHCLNGKHSPECRGELADCGFRGSER